MIEKMSVIIMDNELLNNSATQLLFEESEKILLLIENQNVNCISCPVFEEIMDTKLFGFSEKVNFAIDLGVVDEETGLRLLNHLERAMNKVYEQMMKNK